MPSSIAIGQTSSKGSPVLDFWTHSKGVLTDPSALEFQIFDVSTPEKEETPVQIFPSTPGQKHTVDLVADKVGLGHFAAAWAPASDALKGRYQIRWFFTMPGGVEQTVVRDFDLVPTGAAARSRTYALVSDLRDEGVLATGSGAVTTARLHRALVLASSFVEVLTGRFFEPRYKVHKANGSGARALILGEPICAIEGVKVASSPYYQGDIDIEPDYYRVHNRHLTERLIEPDDRDAPKLVMFHQYDTQGVRYVPSAGLRLLSFAFPYGQQNVQVTGAFGYTDPDPDTLNTLGDTPALIRHVTKLLALREVPKIVKNSDEREESMLRWRILSERTRDQQYQLADPRPGAFTGDNEIDTILARFQRPMQFGAV